MQKHQTDRGVPLFVGRVEVADALGVSAKTLDRMVAARKFPRPVQISSNRVGWPLEVVNAHLRSRIEGVTGLAVSDPEQLVPEAAEQAILELGARLASLEVGESVSAKQMRVVIEKAAPGSEVDHRAELLQELENHCGKFEHDRALLIAASVFPAIREQLLREAGNELMRDPERLRELAVRCLDDQFWNELQSLRT